MSFFNFFSCLIVAEPWGVDCHVVKEGAAELFLFIISLITFFMLFCCFEDSDKYYDPDLL